jgi:hypothetical protein
LRGGCAPSRCALPLFKVAEKYRVKKRREDIHKKPKERIFPEKRNNAGDEYVERVT